MSDTEKASRETRSRYPRLVPLATRWGDNDVYGHVNNVVSQPIAVDFVQQFGIGGGQHGLRTSWIGSTKGSTV